MSDGEFRENARRAAVRRAMGSLAKVRRCRAYPGAMRADIGENAGVNEDLEQRLAAARERVRELSSDLRSDTMQAWQEARERQLQAERDLGAARGEQYAKVIDIGPRWDTGARCRT